IHRPPAVRNRAPDRSRSASPVSPVATGSEVPCGWWLPHQPDVLRTDGLSTRVTAVELVPCRDGRLATSPAEQNPPALPGRGKVDEAMLESTLRESQSSLQAPPRDHLLDLGRQCSHPPTELLRLLAVGVACFTKPAIPHEIQHLEFVRHFTRVFHPLPDPGDHFLQQGNENVRFRNREGLPEHRGHFPPRGWCAIPNGMLACRPPETPVHPSSAAGGAPYHPAPQDLMARSGVLPPAPDLRRTAH